MIDLKHFWLSLKLSWLRRSLKTNSYWLNILELETSCILGRKINIYELLQLGPCKLKSIGKQFKNNFWKEVFITVDHFMQGALHCIPENFIVAPLWENSMILRNNKPLKATNFQGFNDKVNMVGDLYQPESGEFLTREELERMYQVELSVEKFMELKYIINSTIRSLGIKENSVLTCPRPCQPLLMKIFVVVSYESYHLNSFKGRL